MELWHGKTWAHAAETANRGLNGQGYIVDAMMQASQVGTRLTYWIIALMLVQIVIAVR